MKIKTTLHKGTWVNGAGIRVSHPFEVDENGNGVFRIGDGVYIRSHLVVGLPSFRWEEPVTLNLEPA